MVIMSERKLAEWKKSKEVFSFAVVTYLERLVTFICSHGLFVKKKQSLFWQISRVEDKRKKQQGDKGRGERERERERQRKKETKKARREHKRIWAPEAACAVQGEKTHAENVKTSKKVAKYFLEPP